MERTLRWAERARAAHRRPDQALFGIVQGGVDPELRAESARRTADAGLSRVRHRGAVGGGVGGGARASPSTPSPRRCPPERPRYVMGLGDTAGVLDAVARGFDLFDCVWPTRLARHGKALTARGRLLDPPGGVHHRSRPRSIPDCRCFTCRHHSRGLSAPPPGHRRTARPSAAEHPQSGLHAGGARRGAGGDRRRRGSRRTDRRSSSGACRIAGSEGLR